MTDWIPVSERLPNRTDLYWCAFINADGVAGTWFFAWAHKGKRWFSDDDPDGNRHRITHWMPLPEPPQ